LHAACVTYDYSGYGETPVVVLVNPAKTITVPRGETGKMRTVEMKIALINPNPHGVHIDEALIEEADAEYNQVTIEQLQQVLETKTWEALEIEGEVPNISLKDVARIKEMLQQRITEIS
jgi:hypothetical protein